MKAERWSLQDAKNSFSAVVEAATQGRPQHVALRGKPGRSCSQRKNTNGSGSSIGMPRPRSRNCFWRCRRTICPSSALKYAHAISRSDPVAGRVFRRMYLLDTVVLSELRRRQRDPRVVKWVSAQRPSDLNLSVITLGEIERGITQQRQANPDFALALAAWLDGLLNHYADRILPVDTNTASMGSSVSATGSWRRRSADRCHRPGTWPDRRHPQHKAFRAERGSGDGSLLPQIRQFFYIRAVRRRRDASCFRD